MDTLLILRRRQSQQFHETFTQDGDHVGTPSAVECAVLNTSNGPTAGYFVIVIVVVVIVVDVVFVVVVVFRYQPCLLLLKSMKGVLAELANDQDFLRQMSEFFSRNSSTR